MIEGNFKKKLLIVMTIFKYRLFNFKLHVLLTVEFFHLIPVIFLHTFPRFNII